METARGLDPVARRLAALLSDSPFPRLHVRPLAVGAAPTPPRRVAAVDGSSVTLAESGSHLVGAWRAAGVLLEAERAPVRQHGPIEVGLLDGDEALHEQRARAEASMAESLLERLQPGDLLLLDGALRDQPLLVRAEQKGVRVVGVCKSTSLTIGGAPALAVAHLAGRASGLLRWWIAAEGTIFARLSPAEDRPFRFDIRADDPERVLGALAALAGHPAAPGYPSPLAMAHHAATIQEDERRRLAASVAEAALRCGAREDAWRAVFADYHDVLDLGA